ncbi:hypothetical protein B9Z55_026683 [Caenorhabditis nigoni]|nr:hypothetical protein B9Z55_026683 [Caenorhabditis nigoni]
MSPEMVEVDKFVHGRSADVWSTGVMLMYFFIGILPFKEATSECEFYKSWIAGESSKKLPWHKVPKEPMELIRKILVVDVKKRATLNDIAEDKWLVGEKGQVKQLKKPRILKIKAEKKKDPIQKVEKATKESAKVPKATTKNQKKNEPKKKKQENEFKEDSTDLENEPVQKAEKVVKKSEKVLKLANQKPEKIPKRQAEKRKQEQAVTEVAEILDNTPGPAKRQRIPKKQWAE